MSAEQVAIIPECVECHAVWLPSNPDRWKLELVDVDEHGWYCPACYEVEFGPG